MLVNHLFIEACAQGDLDEAKRLAVLEGMDPCAENYCAFIWTCINGHLDVAKWLMTLPGMDPCAEECEAFRSACMYGHHGVAKWLMTFPGMDPCAENCQAFTQACLNGNLDTAKWLLSLPELCDGLKRLNAGNNHAVFHKEPTGIDRRILEVLIGRRRCNFATAKLFIREVVALPEEVCLKVLWAACGDGDIGLIGASEREFNLNLIK